MASHNAVLHGQARPSTSWPRLHQQLTSCYRVIGTADQLQYLHRLACAVQIFSIWIPQRPFDVHTDVHTIAPPFSGDHCFVVSEGVVHPHVGVTLRWTGAISALAVGMTTASSRDQLLDAYFQQPGASQHRFYHCLISLVPFSVSTRWLMVLSY